MRSTHSVYNDTVLPCYNHRRYLKTHRYIFKFIQWTIKSLANSITKMKREKMDYGIVKARNIFVYYKIQRNCISIECLTTLKNRLTLTNTSLNLLKNARKCEQNIYEN